MLIRHLTRIDPTDAHRVLTVSNLYCFINTRFLQRSPSRTGNGCKPIVGHCRRKMACARDSCSCAVQSDSFDACRAHARVIRSGSSCPAISLVVGVVSRADVSRRAFTLCCICVLCARIETKAYMHSQSDGWRVCRSVETLARPRDMVVR